MFLRENVKNVRVLGGEWEERVWIFLVWESVRKAASGLQTRLSIGVSRRTLREMRAGNRGEMRLRIANGANPMLESAADGGIQRGERCADFSSLLGFL